MNLITTGIAALVSVAMLSGSYAPAADVTSQGVLPADWHMFAGGEHSAASLSWAGEGVLELAALPERVGVRVSSQGLTEAEAKLLTGLAAPEPPTMVMAGMAIGGVVFGRSLLRRRRPG